MKTIVNVPIRLRVDAHALSSDAELLERLVSEAVEKVLTRAAGALRKNGHAGPPVFHPPQLLWGGPGLGDVTQRVRADIEARIRKAVESQVARHRPAPPVPRPPAAVRPWFVVKDLYFHLTVRDYFKFRNEVMYEGELVDPFELYAHMLDERRRAVAWLVQVNREFATKLLNSEVAQRFSVLSKLSPKQKLYHPFIWSDRLVEMLAGMDRDGVVRGAIPSFKKYREKYLEGRTENAKGVIYVKPGGRLLIVFMALPAFDLGTLVRGDPVLDRTLPLRALDSLVDPLTFEGSFGAPWATILKAYGDEPVPLSIEPFTVEQPVPERSLGALFEGRRRGASGVIRLGRTLLLNDESLAPLTPAVRALLEPLSNPETRAVKGLPPQGRQWQPGWRGVSVTPRFNIARERLEIVSWHPWAQRNAAELAGYLRLGKYPRRDRLRHWLIATWPDTDRWALLDLLLLELERLGVHEQFLQLLRDEAPNVGFYLRPVARLLEKTRYAPLVKRLGVVEAYSRATRGLRRHGYDVEAQEIRPWHEEKRRVRAGEVLADHVYIFQEKFDALRPTEKTMERLAGPARKRAGELLGQLLCEGRQRTQEELMAQAIQEAADALVPPLEEKDFEKVEVSLSYRFLALELADPHDPSSIRVRYKRVRKIENGPWQDVSEEKVDELDRFAGYLAAYEIANMRRAVEAMAAAELALIAGLFAVQAGAVGFMVRVAGGRLPVLLTVAAREAIYLYKVATSQEEFTLGGFLLNAFKGWLDAVGFRFGSMAGLGLGKLITAGGVRLLLAGATARILIRALGVGVSFVVEQFVEDVILLVRCNKWQGSARKYVGQLGFGFAVGLGFELLAPLLGAAAKPLLERLKPLLKGTQDKMEVLKLLLKELTPEQAALWLRLSMERVGAALRELLDNPKVVQELAEALRGKGRELVDALPDALKALRAAPGRAAGAVKKEYKAAFFQELFDLAGIELRGPVLEGFERLLGAAGTRDVYGLVRTLLKQKGASGFIASLRVLDARALERLVASGELERIVGSARLTEFLSTRAGLGWGLLERVFEGSAVKLEALLKDLGPLAPDAREAVLELLRTHGQVLPPRLRVSADALWRLSALDRGLLEHLDEAALVRLAALERSALEGLQGLSADVVKKLAALDKRVLETLAGQTAGAERRAALGMLAHEPTLTPELILWAVKHRVPLTPEVATGLRRLSTGLDPAREAAALKLMEADAARAGALLTELGRGNDALVSGLLRRGDLELLLDASKSSAAEAAQVASALAGSSKGVLTDMGRVTGNAVLTTAQLLEVVRGGARRSWRRWWRRRWPSPCNSSGSSTRRPARGRWRGPRRSTCSTTSWSSRARDRWRTCGSGSTSPRASRARRAAARRTSAVSSASCARRSIWWQRTPGRPSAWAATRARFLVRASPPRRRNPSTSPWSSPPSSRVESRRSSAASRLGPSTRRSSPWMA